MNRAIPLYFLILILALNACNLRPQVSIMGTTTGVASGVVSIKDRNGQTINAGRINNNKFRIDRLYLKRAGFYNLVLSPDGQPNPIYPVYLETGTYTISFGADKGYPVIKSSSQIQKELSAYYSIKDSLLKTKKQVLADLKADLNRKMDTSDPEKLNAAIQKLAEANLEAFSSDATALNVFTIRYPDNKVAAHLLSGMRYENDPDKYYVVYNKFNEYNKGSSEGKEIGEKLAQLTKLKDGAMAPGVAGLTPEGKKVDLKKLGTRLILVEFWRAGSGISRLNHQEMLANPFDAAGRDVSMVSISFDTKRDWWLGSVKDDKIKWTQVSDLKGDDSPNAKNWAVTIIPTYYLLDGEGRIIEREIPFSSIRGKINAYLAAHPN